MKPLDYPLLADENIHPAVIGGLISTGMDVRTVRTGHIEPQFVLQILVAIRRSPVEPSPPFILVAERKGDLVRVKVRSASEP
jgi:hypothetical protein